MSLKLITLYFFSIDKLIANHLYNLFSFIGITTITIDIPILKWTENTFVEKWIKTNIPTIKLYYLPLGNILTILAANKLKQIINTDPIKAFLNLFIIFLSIEGSLLFIHTILKYNYLYAELLFYTKITAIICLLYLFNRIHYNKIVKIIFILSIIILTTIKLSIIILLYYDIYFMYNMVILEIQNKTSLLVSSKIQYTNNIYIFIYLKYFLSPFLFIINLSMLLYYQVNKEKYLKHYTKIKSKLFN